MRNDPTTTTDTTAANTRPQTDWRWQLCHAVRGAAELQAHLGLDGAGARRLVAVADRFPLLITPYYLSLARGDWPADPILRQCVPDPAEIEAGPAAEPDPFCEDADQPAPGLVRRYPDRVLFIATNRCAVHCRHCLRKRLWRLPPFVVDAQQVERAADYIGRHPEIREVIISGGDPLLLEDAELEHLLGSFRRLPNVELLRLASRLPVVLPQRIDAALCRVLSGAGPTWFVTHFNHPYELTDASAAACGKLVEAGIPVLNQTVLLRGVNDDADVLEELFRGLLRQRVKPYYLFHGDPVAGAVHFRTGIERGLAIMRELRGRLSGLAMPTFAIDLPGGGGKVPLQPDYAVECPGCEGMAFRGFQGDVVPYPET